MGRLGALNPHPLGLSPSCSPTPASQQLRRLRLWPLKHRAFLRHSAKGTRGKMRTMSALVSPLENKRQKGPERAG